MKLRCKLHQVSVTFDLISKCTFLTVVPPQDFKIILGKYLHVDGMFA